MALGDTHARPARAPRGPGGLRRLAANRPAIAGLALLTLLAAAALFAPFLTPHQRDAVNLPMRLKPPGTLNPVTGRVHLLGTDQYGRDLATRLLYGARVSLGVGLVAAGVSLGLGVLVGGLAGGLGGWTDRIMMRLVDILLSLPVLPLVLTVLALVGNSIWLIVFVLGATSWMDAARLVRAEVLALREREFVQAARATGAPELRILLRHIAPNLTHVLIVAATLRVAGAMLAEATLSYLGIGVQPPVPSWGNILYEHQNYQYLRTALWTNLFPGLSLFSALLSLYFVGDALRDALDPRLKH